MVKSSILLFDLKSLEHLYGCNWFSLLESSKWSFTALNLFLVNQQETGLSMIESQNSKFLLDTCQIIDQAQIKTKLPLSKTETSASGKFTKCSLFAIGSFWIARRSQETFDHCSCSQKTTLCLHAPGKRSQRQFDSPFSLRSLRF